MRYHKAIEITRPEADHIIETSTSSCNDVVVLSHHDTWYDVRRMTTREVDEFVAGLLRADMANLQAGCITPH